MKKLLVAALAIVVFAACKNDVKDKEPVTEEAKQEAAVIEAEKDNRASRYETPIAKTLLAHGGLKKWDNLNNLCYEMDGNNGKEIHTTSLKNRMAKIEHKDWAIGYDGTDVWLQNHEKDAYQGNARFYHNLMFYFYAMPFVLADDGITYEKLPQTTLDGDKYDAVKISYNDGIGDSPKDEYILYSNPKSGKMEWLGYTVTYRSGEKSNDWHYIKYDDWQDVNGLMLPSKLTWYNADENGPTDEKSDLRFDKVTATETMIPATVFAMPEGAKVVKK